MGCSRFFLLEPIRACAHNALSRTTEFMRAFWVFVSLVVLVHGCGATPDFQGPFYSTNYANPIVGTAPTSTRLSYQGPLSSINNLNPTIYTSTVYGDVYQLPVFDPVVNMYFFQSLYDLSAASGNTYTLLNGVYNSSSSQYANNQIVQSSYVFIDNVIFRYDYFGIGFVTPEVRNMSFYTSGSFTLTDVESMFQTIGYYPLAFATMLLSQALFIPA